MALMKDNQVIAGDFYDDTELHNKRYISYCPALGPEFNKLGPNAQIVTFGTPMSAMHVGNHSSASWTPLTFSIFRS